MIDKPKRGADHYHTCYCLSGLSTAQHHVIYGFEEAKGKDLDSGARSLLWKDDVTNRIVLGDPNNLIVNIKTLLHKILWVLFIRY